MICIDELGPLSAKTYPGEQDVPGERRATCEPDYGRRGKLWVHGAFEPATGAATLVSSERRDGASHLQLLEQMIARFPAERWLVIEDTRSTHASRDVQTALLSWPEIQIQFLPTYASGMHLIEPWWKQRKSLALKGRRFQTADEIQHAMEHALAYWNEHRRPYRWRKVPDVLPTPPLGGYGSILTPRAA
ncbi:MAG: transposase [Gemmatimonadetes bacterium]|nr:transposase [Gemmatimonadota bacterium]